MKGRTGSVLTMGLGVVLIVAALVVRFVVVPALSQYPGEDSDPTTRIYEGTMNRLLNAAALQDPSQPLFLENLPVVIERSVETLETSGGNAVLEDSQVMTAGGNPLLESTTYYEIDRETFLSVESDDSRVLPRSCEADGGREGCLVVTWPIGVEQRDYTGWSDDPAVPVTVRYIGEEEHAGQNTYKFQATVPTSQIVDPTTLASFPPALPKASFAGLAAQLGGELPPELAQQLGAIVPQLPDPVPLAYTYETEVTYWVDPEIGILLDIDRHDVRKVALEVPGAGLTPLTEVYDLNFTTSAQSIEDAKDDASGYATALLWGKTIAPIALGVLGLLAILGGAFLARRRPTS